MFGVLECPISSENKECLSKCSSASPVSCLLRCLKFWSPSVVKGLLVTLLKHQTRDLKDSLGVKVRNSWADYLALQTCSTVECNLRLILSSSSLYSCTNPWFEYLYLQPTEKMSISDPSKCHSEKLDDCPEIETLIPFDPFGKWQSFVLGCSEGKGEF